MKIGIKAKKQLKKKSEVQTPSLKIILNILSMFKKTSDPRFKRENVLEEFLEMLHAFMIHVWR